MVPAIGNALQLMLAGVSNESRPRLKILDRVRDEDLRRPGRSPSYMLTRRSPAMLGVGRVLPGGGCVWANCLPAT